jgi:hypothetical protein
MVVSCPCDVLPCFAKIPRKIAAFGSAYNDKKVFLGIVTKPPKVFIKSIYNIPHLPKSTANKANVINNVTAPTKAVNPAVIQT